MASRKLEVVFVGDTKQLDQSFKRVGKGADTAEPKMAKLGKAIAGAFVVQKVAEGAKFAAEAATDLGEQVNKVSVVFRGSQKDLLKWSKSTASSFGISQRAALEAAGTFGNMLVPMGFARKNAEQMSKRMVGLAADMASFNNASPEETLDAIRAGLAGETEPLRRFGVFLNDARLKQEAMNLGLKDAIGPNGALTANAKAQATYSLILKDTKDAQGDFSRTSGSLANQQRILKAETENLAASVGTALIPAATKLAGIAVGLLGTFQKLPGPVQTTIGVLAGLAVGATALGLVIGPLTAGIAAVGTVATAMAGAFSAAMAVARLAWFAAFGPIGLGVAAAIAAGILLWKNWDTVTAALSAAWNFAKDQATAAFGAIVGTVTGAWNAIKSTTVGVWDAIRGALGAVFGAIKTAVLAYFTAYKTVILAQWHAVRDVGSAIWSGIRTGLSTVWNGIKGTASTAWDAIRDAVVHPVRSAVDTVGGLVGDLWDRVHRGFDRIMDGARDFAGNLKDKIVGAIRGAANGVLDFVNAIIGVINKIPGVEIGKVKALAQGGTIGGPQGNPHGQRPIGTHAQALYRGGKVTRPLAIVGEEAPKHPEYVVPTNPAYRGRALGLFGALGNELGVPGFKIGGVIGKGLDLAGNAVSGAVNLVKKGAGFFLEQLPGVGNLAPWLKDTGRWVLSKATGFIKDKVSSILNVLDGGGVPKGLAPALKIARMIQFANKLDAMDIPYGAAGHGGWGINPAGEDCSSTVSKVLHSAGYLASVLTTVGLPGALKHGAGKYVTVHDRALPGNLGHTIIQIGDRFFGTSGQNPAGGPGWISASSGYLSQLPTKLHPEGLGQGGVASGGWVRVGELGPEWAQLPAGTRVMQASESAGFHPGNGGPLIGELHVHERVDERVLARELAWAVQTGG